MSGTFDHDPSALVALFPDLYRSVKGQARNFLDGMEKGSFFHPFWREIEDLRDLLADYAKDIKKLESDLEKFKNSENKETKNKAEKTLYAFDTLLNLPELVQNVATEARDAIETWEKHKKQKLTDRQTDFVRKHCARMQIVAYIIREQFYSLLHMVTQQLSDGIFKGITYGAKTWNYSLRDILQATLRITEKGEQLKETLKKKQTRTQEKLAAKYKLDKWVEIQHKFRDIEDEYSSYKKQFE